MIYFDNAATSYPKPPSVVRVVRDSFGKYCANPGRAGHSMAAETSAEIYRIRSLAAEFFGAMPENVIFTASCTQAINYVLKGFLQPGDHVVISSLEHNAVYRPLYKLGERGITFSIADVYPRDNDATLDSFRRALTPKTRLIVCTHASNVWGIRLPVERITALAHQYDVKVLVDAAQTAGVVPIDIGHSNIDWLAVAAHKGLFAPLGTGMLIAGQDAALDTVIEGGTGSNSVDAEQPDFLPDRFESGTLNTHGILGIGAGLEYIRSKGQETIRQHELGLTGYLHDKLSTQRSIRLYTERPEFEYNVGVLSFNRIGYPSEETAEMLNRAGIAVRAGLHCAPLAHYSFGTGETGAVRVSFSPSNTKEHVDRLLDVLKG